MRALVVYESMFGNTKRTAEAVADGMSDGAEVVVRDVADAPAELPDDLDLLVVGGPTHAFSMSRRSTREQAARDGGAPHDVAKGLREWLEEVTVRASGCGFAAFDTRLDMPLLPGAASHTATRIARRRGFAVTEPTSFLVAGYRGPVVSGQLPRAREWGHSLTELLAG